MFVSVNCKEWDGIRADQFKNYKFFKPKTFLMTLTLAALLPYGVYNMVHATQVSFAFFKFSQGYSYLLTRSLNFVLLRIWGLEGIPAYSLRLLCAAALAR